MMVFETTPLIQKYSVGLHISCYVSCFRTQELSLHLKHKMIFNLEFFLGYPGDITSDLGPKEMFFFSSTKIITIDFTKSCFSSLP